MKREADLKNTIQAAAWFFCLAGALHAAELASWNLDGLDPQANPVAANVSTASGVESTVAQSMGGTRSRTGTINLSQGAAYTDFSQSLAAGDYISIQITAADGQLLDLISLTIYADRNGANLDGSEGIAVYSSADGFSTPVFTFTGDFRGISHQIALSGHTGLASNEFRYCSKNQPSGQYLTLGDWSDGDGVADIVISGAVVSATGPADLSYINDITSAIKPGEPQTVQAVIRNDGTDATNVTATLSSLDGSFAVNSGTVTTALIAANSQVTNDFTVTAVSNTPAQLYSGAFKIDIQGYGTDNNPDTDSSAVPVEVLSTVFCSLSKSAFASATNGTDTATLTVSNTAAFPLQFSLTDTETWLTYPVGTLTLAGTDSTGITVTANGSLTAGQGQYSNVLSVSYLNNGSLPNPSGFPLTYDVGPKVSYVSNRVTVVSGGILPALPTGFDAEPDMRLNIEVFSVNDGAYDVSNVVNTLSANPAYFTVTNLTPAQYTLLKRGDMTSTVYQVDVKPGTPHGAYDFAVTNSLPSGP